MLPADNANAFQDLRSALTGTPPIRERLRVWEQQKYEEFRRDYELSGEAKMPAVTNLFQEFGGRAMDSSRAQSLIESNEGLISNIETYDEDGASESPGSSLHLRPGDVVELL